MTPSERLNGETRAALVNQRFASDVEPSPDLRDALLALRRKDMPDGPCWCSVEPNATYATHERKCLSVRAVLHTETSGEPS